VAGDEPEEHQTGRGHEKFSAQGGAEERAE
jgi:hypothetical protein